MKLYKVKAFTLVELIVVITILAILGTIAFINLQGYSLGARDGKRLSDINNILKKLGIEEIKGELITDYIDNQATNTVLINGNTGSAIQGIPNFTRLKEDGSKFKDPITKGDYLLSYSKGGTSTGSYKYTQIATVNEENNQAIVKGNYYEMQVGDSPSIVKNTAGNFVVDGGVELPYDVNLVVLGGTGTPEDGVCGKDANKHLYVMPTRLCDAGTIELLNDEGILADYTWECHGINEGINVKCKGRHAFAWDYVPADIRDIFGNRSIYTEIWESNTCDPSSMSIVDLTPGTDVIPTTLADNTIYRLSGGNYINTTGITSGICSGIIGNGNVTLFSSVRINNYLSLKDNFIATGVKFDGLNNGVGGIHANSPTWPWTNINGLAIFGNPGYVDSRNLTLNNVDIFNFSGTFDIYNIACFNNMNIYNNGIGLDVRYVGNSVFTNINTFNNSGHGVYTDGVYNTVFSNIKSFNNSTGIDFAFDTYTTYTNISSFNNSGNGIRYSSEGIVNNIYSYNNAGTTGGIRMYIYGYDDGLYYTNFNNIYSYNNNIGITSSDPVMDSYLYGNIKLFGNTSSSFSGSMIPFGTNSTLGFSDGTSLDTSGTFGASWVVQPSIAGWNINTKGKQSLTFDGTETYTYGSNILNQTQPVRYDPITNIPELWGVDGVHYDSSKKVGQW